MALTKAEAKEIEELRARVAALEAELEAATAPGAANVRVLNPRRAAVQWGDGEHGATFPVGETLMPAARWAELTSRNGFDAFVRSMGLVVSRAL